MRRTFAASARALGLACDALMILFAIAAPLVSLAAFIAD